MKGFLMRYHIIYTDLNNPALKTRIVVEADFAEYTDCSGEESQMLILYKASVTKQGKEIAVFSIQEFRVVEMYAVDAVLEKEELGTKKVRPTYHNPTLTSIK
jgi:hypothetical protein